MILLHLLASAIVMMAEANTRGLEFKKMESDLSQEKDPETEISQEKDAFPDLLSFATYFNQ